MPEIEDEVFTPRVQIMGTNPNEPENGRVFVWTKMGWFERLQGEIGDVAFTPIADSEQELREIVLQVGPQADLFSLGEAYTRMVTREFLDQYPSPVDSHDHPNQEMADEDQEYHQHDL